MPRYYSVQPRTHALFDPRPRLRYIVYGRFVSYVCVCVCVQKHSGPDGWVNLRTLSRTVSTQRVKHAPTHTTLNFILYIYIIML